MNDAVKDSSLHASSVIFNQGDATNQLSERVGEWIQQTGRKISLVTGTIYDQDFALLVRVKLVFPLLELYCPLLELSYCVFIILLCPLLCVVSFIIILYHLSFYCVLC